MTLCVFCGAGVRKTGRSKEHILPMWLLKATGDPHRKIRIELDPDSGADVIRPASTFHFPACKKCNQIYGKKLEAHAQRAMSALSDGHALPVSQCYQLLDWLDKVRIGLWLGYHILHKEIFVPKFRIDSRLGKKDRIAIISVDRSDTFKGFSVGGCDNNVFRTSQAGIYLRINNVRILSLSFDGLISFFAGVPYMDEMYMLAEDPSQHVGNINVGNYKISQDWGEFSKLGATIIAQPIFCPGGMRRDAIARTYFNKRMLARMKNDVRISKPEHLDRAYQMQLISNAGGSFAYYSAKNKRIRFCKAERNDDAAFMHSLYSILLKHVLPLNPQLVINRNGKQHGTIVMSLLYVEKLLQIVRRLEGLGISNPKLKAELIDEVHLLTRLREESQSHIPGSCTPESRRLLVS